MDIINKLHVRGFANQKKQSMMQNKNHRTTQNTQRGGPSVARNQMRINKERIQKDLLALNHQLNVYSQRLAAQGVDKICEDQSQQNSQRIQPQVNFNLNMNVNVTVNNSRSSAGPDIHQTTMDSKAEVIDTESTE